MKKEVNIISFLQYIHKYIQVIIKVRNKKNLN